MADTVPDDIFALCSRFNLDLDSYRIFPREESVTAAVQVRPVPFDILPTENATEQVSSVREMRTDSDFPAYPLGRFTLRNLWTHVGLATGRCTSRSLPDLLKSSILITGATGGSGATTVTATLARLMSQKKQRCGVITSHDNAVLPCYFGDGSLLHGRQSAFSVTSGHGTPIRILSRQSIEKEISPSDVSYDLDQMLIDLESGFDLTSSTNLLGGAVTVVVAVPDVNSVIQARQLKATLADALPATPVICVLNKFDASHPIHCEIRDWFMQTFSSVATLCRTELVNEALAEGMTVADWSPQSELAQEYSQLLGLLQNARQFQLSSEVLTAC